MFRTYTRPFANTGITIKARMGIEEEHWSALDDLVRPDLKLIVQVESDGDIANAARVYEKIKTRCRDILARKQRVNHYVEDSCK